MDKNLLASAKKLAPTVSKAQSMTLASMPFIIKSHHCATIREIGRSRANAYGYKDPVFQHFQVSFEGPGFQKIWPHKFKTKEGAVNFVQKLGFRKYRIRWNNGCNRFYEYSIENKYYKNPDGLIDWRDCYDENVV